MPPTDPVVVQPAEAEPPPVKDRNRDKLNRVESRILWILDTVTRRLARQLKAIEKEDPGGFKLPEGNEFVKYGRWSTKAIAEVEALRIQRERSQPDDPIGTPDDDFALMSDALKGLGVDKKTLLIEQLKRSVDE